MSQRGAPHPPARGAAAGCTARFSALVLSSGRWRGTGVRGPRHLTPVPGLVLKPRMPLRNCYVKAYRYSDTWSAPIHGQATVRPASSRGTTRNAASVSPPKVGRFRPVRPPPRGPPAVPGVPGQGGRGGDRGMGPGVLPMGPHDPPFIPEVVPLYRGNVA